MRTRVDPGRLLATVVAMLTLGVPGVMADADERDRLTIHLDAARQRLSSLNHGQVDAYAVMARVDVKAGRMRQARESMHALRGMLAETDPSDQLNHRVVASALAEAQIALGQIDEAMRTLEQVRVAGSMAHRERGYAVVHVWERDGLRAARTLIMNTVPNSYDRRMIYTALAWHMADVGQSDEAVRFLDDAMSLLPTSDQMPAYIGLAERLHGQGQTDDALDILRFMRMQLDRKDAVTTQLQLDTTIELAQGYRAIGRSDEARSLLHVVATALAEKELSAFVRNPIVRDLAAAWADLGDMDEAENLIATIEADTAVKMVRARMAHHALSQGRIEEMRELHRAHELNVYLPMPSTLIRHHLRQGNINEAAAELGEANPFATEYRSLVREVARAFIEHRHDAAFDAWAARHTSAAVQFYMHLGAAEGLLAREPR